MEKEKIRINKYISQCGICSRREADRRVEEGRITINGRPAVMGDMVSVFDDVRIDGIPVKREEKEIILAYHKPAGIICTTSKKEKNNIIDALDFPERIYPVGRLDKDSTGLILLTNNGQLMDDILRGSNYHEKEYVVTLNRPMKPEIYTAMEQGVPILDTITRPCRITRRERNGFHIILTQGLNRQIRRMCEYFGYRVQTLKRIRIMNITLGDLPEGQWRYLTEEETLQLKKSCKERKEKNGTGNSSYERTGK
ncbi:MAG: pseudouridine synthase [Lachnospiraceae bacterium]|nr:pseudouridine synthase [Lachnospiraceae bacterium]